MNVIHSLLCKLNFHDFGDYVLDRSTETEEHRKSECRYCKKLRYENIKKSNNNHAAYPSSDYNLCSVCGEPIDGDGHGHQECDTCYPIQEMYRR